MSAASEYHDGTLKVCPHESPLITEQTMRNWPTFTTWLERTKLALSKQDDDLHPFHKDPYKLSNVEVQAVDVWPSPSGPKIGFVKADCQIKNGAGGILGGGMFMRGPAVSMMILLKPDDAKNDDDLYAVILTQPRPAIGSLMLPEIPAGMMEIDNANGGRKFTSAIFNARKEIKEETHLDFEEEDIIDLFKLASLSGPAKEHEARLQAAPEKVRRALAKGETVKKTDLSDAHASLERWLLPEGYFPSVGGCEEYLNMFVAIKTMPRASIEKLEGKETGVAGENEKIVLKVRPFKTLFWENRHDGKTLSTLGMFHSLRNEGLFSEEYLGLYKKYLRLEREYTRLYNEKAGRPNL